MKIVSVLVAPSAKEASSYSLGTARIAVSDTEMTDGNIMTARTKIAENRFAPSGNPKNSRTVGTMMIIPTRPYTTEGIPDIRLTAPLTNDAVRLPAIFARKTAHKIPSGTPIRIAPNVPYTDVRINGRIP